MRDPFDMILRAVTKPTVPTFATEAEEAKWWFENRAAHGKAFARAVERGEAKLLTRKVILDRIAASKKKDI